MSALPNGVVNSPMNSASPSRLAVGFQRRGPSHRDGADVSFADVRRFFGFASVKIGRWVTTAEQQLAANLFFDALCDLALILQLPANALSLNATLSLAFGTGGRRNVCAHYDGQQHLLALAKNAGGGSLAHEWFHAFDHYIGPKAFHLRRAYSFASVACLESRPVRAHPLNKLLEDALTSMFLNNGQPTSYFQHAAAQDARMRTFYFAKPQEMGARAFESFVQDQPIKNSFLVQGTKASKSAAVGLYPSGDERTTINRKLFAYFSQLGLALTKKSS